MVEGIKCPNCGSVHVARVIYGMPFMTVELDNQIENGDVKLYGCCIDPDTKMYPYVCEDCGFEFDDRMAACASAEVFFSAEDYAWIKELAEAEGVLDDDARACKELAQAIMNDEPSDFELLLEEDERAYRRYGNPTFARLMILGLEYGVACKDGACANYLGALYYGGNVVEQNYDRAKELYELAESKEIVQAIINLGYIYEYGRCGEPDYLKAYWQYSKAISLSRSPEAYYKMGDMYRRGQAVEQDLRFAWRLYEMSLVYGYSPATKAQPAFRIAQLVSDPENQALGIPYDPMRALELFQLAERGMRIDIANGMTYYAKRLQEAIEGQNAVRKVLDGGEDI